MSKGKIIFSHTELFVNLFIKPHFLAFLTLERKKYNLALNKYSAMEDYCF